MIKVDNKKSIHKLARRFLKINKGRNIIVIIAIVLTSILFTSIFTASFSVVKSTMQSEMRMTMDKSHVSAQELTKEQYEKIKKDSSIEKQGLSIFLTLAENKELSNIQTEIRYADQNGADSFLSYPTTGELPQKGNEIATSTIVLDALGLDHKLGENVTLTYTIGDRQISKEFTLSGYWQGDSIAMAQMAWVSKAYCDSVAPVATEESIGNGDYAGDYNLSIWYSNPLHLEQKAEDLAEKYGLTDSNASVSANPAYIIFGEDAFPFSAVAILLAIIMVSGYLIIYNVFNISVNTDIRAYGLLKNIGTTGKQLKSIVLYQAFSLSAIGIPIGILLGFFIGKTMTPYLLSDLSGNGNNAVTAVPSFHPLIFVAAALFSLITIYIGCLKPCRIVRKLSPVEAVRMTDAKSDKKKTKKRGKVSPFFMALSNLKRSWKKSFAVVISLALSLMVLNMTYMIVNGFDFDSYTSTLISADFEINHFTTTLNDYEDLNCITPKIQKTLTQNQDVAATGYVYFTRSTHHLDDTAYRNLKAIIDETPLSNFYASQKKEIKKVLETREVTSHVMGINEAVFDKLNFAKGSHCTWQEFASGKYIITDFLDVGGKNYYTVGDKVNVEFDDDTSKEYRVLALANLPYTLDYNYYDGPVFQTFFLPVTEYQTQTGNVNAMVATIDTKAGKLADVDQWLRHSLEKYGNSLILNSRYDIESEFQNYVNKYYMIGGMLTAVLFVIGVLNYFNMSATSVLARKKELSLLEVVGMTKRQILKMLITEGLFYIVIAFILAMTVGALVANQLVTMAVGDIFFFQCKISVLPSIILIPVLLLVAFFVPVYHYKKMCKETVVERIRNE